jgi:hypothetical protein
MTTVAAAELMAQLEELWGHYDTLLGALAPADWKRKFGRDWDYGDVPRHLAYFDREVLTTGIERGPALPAERQVLMHTHREFNDWNDRNLAERRQQPMAGDSQAQLRATRDDIRRMVAPLTDADLERPIWISLPGVGGWRTVRFALEFCRQHAWMHFIQLRLRLKRLTPEVSPAITHGALNGIIRSFAGVLNRSLANRTRLTAIIVLTGSGGGAWSIRVADGACQMAEGCPAAGVDLTITQSSDTLIEVLSQMRHPLAAMLTGHMRVAGWRHLPRFLQLFARPAPDQLIALIP